MKSECRSKKSECRSQSPKNAEARGQNADVQQTDEYAVRNWEFSEDNTSILPRTDEARILGKQLLRSGTSVGANYRAAGRARSKAEFIAKLGMVLEESDETVFWLELLQEAGLGGIAAYG